MAKPEFAHSIRLQLISMITGGWFFENKELDTLIKSALEKNSDLALALNSIESSRVALGLSKLEYLQNFSIKGSGLRQSVAPDLNSGSSFGLSALLNYEIDLWGRVRNSVVLQNQALMLLCMIMKGC